MSALAQLQRIMPAIGVLMLFSACTALTPVRAPKASESPLPEAQWAPYRIQIDDQLDVKFWGNVELDQSVRVRPDGMISLPYVDDVRAAGGQRVYLGGEVGNRGSLRLFENMTLLQAIQEAGGFLNSSRREQVLLIRAAQNGERVARSVNLRPVLNGTDLTADVLLQHDDIIFIPRTKIANINLIVDQYVNSIIPFQALATAAIIQSDLFQNNGSSDNSSAPEPDTGTPDDGSGGVEP